MSAYEACLPPDQHQQKEGEGGGGGGGGEEKIKFVQSNRLSPGAVKVP